MPGETHNYNRYSIDDSARNVERQKKNRSFTSVDMHLRVHGCVYPYAHLLPLPIYVSVCGSRLFTTGYVYAEQRIKPGVGMS